MMSRGFLPQEAFIDPGSGSYHLLPFRFLALDDRREILTSLSGEYFIGERGLARRLACHQLPVDSDLYRILRARHFLYDDQSSPLLSTLAVKMRTKKAPVLAGVGLHLFVVTLRCEH